MTVQTDPIIDVNLEDKHLQVFKEGDHYNVVVSGKIKHSRVDAEGVMRALAHYIDGLSYKLFKTIDLNKVIR